MTTGMDRLVAAIEGKESDRIPVFCNLLDQGFRELGMSAKEYYSKGEHVAEAQIRLQKKYGYDNVWSLFYVGKEAEMLGCRDILFSESGPPNVADFVIKNYDDIHKLEIPDNVFDHPSFEETRKCISILKSELGSKNPICAYIMSAMTLPTVLMGMENWLNLLFLGPPDVRDELLAKCADVFRKKVDAYRQAGANCLLYTNGFGSTETVSMEQFEELSIPCMERELAGLGMDDLIYYCGSSPFDDVIDRVITKFGFKFFYLSPRSDVAEAKKEVAGRGLTCGVINDIPLIDWPDEKIREEVKRIIEAGKPGGRFLFGTLIMPLQIPEHKIRVMLEAAYEYGRY